MAIRVLQEEEAEKIRDEEKRRLTKIKRHEASSRNIGMTKELFGELGGSVLGQTYKEVKEFPSQTREFVKTIPSRVKEGTEQVLETASEEITTRHEGFKARKEFERLQAQKQYAEEKAKRAGLLSEKRLEKSVKRQLEREDRPKKVKSVPQVQQVQPTYVLPPQYIPPPRPRRIPSMYALTHARGFMEGASPIDGYDPFSEKNPFFGKNKKNFLNDPNPFGL